MFTFLTQSKLEVKKEADESPPSEAACLCSPPPAKNQCASCGMEIQDRYLLKVRNLKTSGGKYLHIHKYLPISCLVQALLQTLKSSDGFSFFCPPPSYISNISGTFDTLFCNNFSCFPAQVNNLNWHLGCLECSVCRASLRQHNSCYVKNKEIFCKLDYFR